MYPQKVDVKSCGKVEPPHPCDPPPPCDPLKEPEGDCFPPFLCRERLKNPESPDSITRCRNAPSIGVRSCEKPPPPHPCDNPLPCSTFKNKKQQCDEPPLCVERIKNPKERKTRWVVCTNSKGEVEEREVYKDD
ncbi:uncharacterized protein LOC135084057 [Ostrinia nubilalis]|uniref:uncharacterized protein LOC135084057 n=1 Tax=Ostrinia nubilalis TaxID=29057 RepID=UPI003082455E